VSIKIERHRNKTSNRHNATICKNKIIRNYPKYKYLEAKLPSIPEVQTKLAEKDILEIFVRKRKRSPTTGRGGPRGSG
jgi:hypothetical protein